MTFQIKKRTNSELFIDRMAALYIGETQFRVGTNKGDQPMALGDWKIGYILRWNANLIPKKFGNNTQGVNLSQNEFNGNVKETY